MANKGIEERTERMLYNIMNGYQPTHGLDKETRILPKGESILENKPSKRLIQIVDELRQFSNLSYYKNLIRELEEELDI